MRYAYVCFTWDDPTDGLTFEIHAVYDNLAAADDWARARAEAMADEPSTVTKGAVEQHFPEGVRHVYWADAEYELAGYIVMEVKS